MRPAAPSARNRNNPHDLVLGIDCSTSSSKAIVWDRFGQRVASGRHPLPLFTPQPSWHEQPAQAWWEATTTAIREALHGIDPRRIAALCIAHQRETFVPVDEAGDPLRSAILWMDERAASLLPALEKTYGREAFHRQTGKPLSGNLSVAKIAWLIQYEPQVFRRTVRFLDVHAFLVHRLTGRYRTGWGCADPTGLFDLRSHRWAEAILQPLGLVPENFPEVHPPGAILGEVLPTAAEVCGLPAGLPVVAGLGDGQASGLGAGVDRAGDAYLSLGTSVVSGTFSPQPVTSEQFRTMTAGIPGAYFLETVILGGTYTIDWFLENFAAGVLEPEESFETLARQVPPGCQGLVLLPYWNSAMNPYWDARASGVVAGWRGVHRSAHLYRAILEGIAFEQRLHSEGVSRELGLSVGRYLAVGGGARSDLWCEILADVTGQPVVRLETRETASLGAAILAAAAAGLYADIPQAVQGMAQATGARFDPQPARHAFYTRLYEDVYRHLYPSLREALARLAEIAASPT